MNHTSGYYEDSEKGELEEEEGISLCPLPQGVGSKINYFIALQSLLMTTCTMYDVRKDKHKKYYVLTFISAIIWVGIYSYLYSPDQK